MIGYILGLISKNNASSKRHHEESLNPTSQNYKPTKTMRQNITLTGVIHSISDEIQKSPQYKKRNLILQTVEQIGSKGETSVRYYTVTFSNKAADWLINPKYFPGAYVEIESVVRGCKRLSDDGKCFPVCLEAVKIKRG